MIRTADRQTDPAKAHKLADALEAAGVDLLPPASARPEGIHDALRPVIQGVLGRNVGQNADWIDVAFNLGTGPANRTHLQDYLLEVEDRDGWYEIATHVAPDEDDDALVPASTLSTRHAHYAEPQRIYAKDLPVWLRQIQPTRTNPAPQTSRRGEAVPLCTHCAALTGGARGEPDFAWRKARRGEPCGAADHAENQRVMADDDLEHAAGKHAYMMAHEAGTARSNPAGAVRTKADEKAWAKAKAQAAKQGREGDWAYVMGIFKRMRKNPRQAPRSEFVVGDRVEPDFSKPGWRVKRRFLGTVVEVRADGTVVVEKRDGTRTGIPARMLMWAAHEKNPAPAPGTPSPSMAQVMGIAKQLGVPNTRTAAFAKGFAYEWKEHGGGLDLLTIGQIAADHLAEDRHYYRNR